MLHHPEPATPRAVGVPAKSTPTMRPPWWPAAQLGHIALGHLVALGTAAALP